MVANVTGIGLIGFGNWGTNLGRNIDAHQECQLLAVSDADAGRRHAARRSHPHAVVVADYRRILDSNDISAVVVATPACTHFKIGWNCVQAGKDMLIEKPFTLGIEDAEALANLAERKNVLIAIDYTYLYNPHVLLLKEVIGRGLVGTVRKLEFTRVNQNAVRNDIDVIFDLACHDLSIVNFILGCMPAAVCGLNCSAPDSPVVTTASLRFRYAGSVESCHRLDWMAPVRERKLMVVGSQRSLLYEDIAGNELVTLFREPIDLATQRIPRGRPIVPSRLEEALFTEIDQFLRCVRDRTPPLSGAPLGVRVMRVLECCRESVARNGPWVTVGLSNLSQSNSRIRGRISCDLPSQIT